MWKPKIKHVKGDHFIVESRTEPGKFYDVYVYRRQCSCEGNFVWKKLCWHIRDLFDREFSIEPIVDSKILRSMDVEISFDQLGSPTYIKPKRSTR